MIELVIEARRRSLGGFEVGRVLPFAKRRSVGPFVFFDHMGPVEMAAGVPRSADVRPHPHIGLSTVTYLFAGEMRHQDSVGSDQAIQPGAVNWMTAGRGITHSERFDGAIRDHGGTVHGIQAWVGLPDGQQEIEPSFSHHGRDSLPTFDRGGAHGRLIAGQAFGEQSPVRTYSPMVYIHWTMPAGSHIVPSTDDQERAAYVVAGKVAAGGEAYGPGQMLVLETGAAARIEASEDSTVMLIGGAPIGPRLIWWNFVASTQARLDQAKADWKAGRFALPPHDRNEFIPLPED
jgi:redox-sensitive bicupin YhaK (pirin superfamily)